MLKVTIITAVYNGSAVISRCIESVRKQTYPNIEYIVVDGASRDGTLDAIQAAGPVVTRLISEPDKGVYDAMNKGIDAATGDIIGFLNADDMLAGADVIAAIAQAFENPQTTVVYGNLTMVDAEKGTPVRYWKPGEYRPWLLYAGWHPPHPAFYCRAAMLKAEGKYNLRYRIAADIDAMSRVLRACMPGAVRYLPREIVRMQAGGMSNANLRAILRGNLEHFFSMRQQGYGILLAAVATGLKLLRKVWQRLTAWLHTPHGAQ